MVKDAKPPFTAEELREWLLAGRSAAYIITKTNIKPSTIKLEACVTAFEMVVAVAADIVASSSSKGKAVLKPASYAASAASAASASGAATAAPSATPSPSPSHEPQVNNIDNGSATSRPPPPPPEGDRHFLPRLPREGRLHNGRKLRQEP